jgi:hypothetical protein
MTDMIGQSSLGLSKLPNELLHRIFEYCHVSVHFNLARTCRRLADCGKPFLKLHDAAYRKHGVVSDLEPLTIPDLLQKVVRDPYVAWNVRSIEIWAARDNWDCWGSIALEVPEDVANTVQPFIAQSDHYEYEWDEIFENKIVNPQELPDEELEVYLGLLREHAHFEQDDLDEAREEFSTGADCFYKLLLILLCPRLNSFKHVNVYDILIDGELIRYVRHHISYLGPCSFGSYFNAILVTRYFGGYLSSFQEVGINNPGHQVWKACETSLLALRLVYGFKLKNTQNYIQAGSSAAS